MQLERINFASHPNPFSVVCKYCHNVLCDCNDTEFQLRELPSKGADDENRMALVIKIDVLAWQELDAPERSPGEANLVDEFLENYPESGRAELQEHFERKRAVARHLHEYRIDPDSIMESELVYFADMVADRNGDQSARNSCSWFLTYQGTQYMVQDCYCPRPECDCQKAHLVFYRCTPAKDRPETVDARDEFIAELPLDGEPKVESTLGISRSQAAEILGQWWDEYQDEVDDLRWRYNTVKQISRLSVSEARKDSRQRDWISDVPATPRTQVGRNDPCPCGSGKKYKKCCMRKKDSLGFLTD